MARTNCAMMVNRVDTGDPLALVPFVLSLFAGGSPLSTLFTIIALFVLAIGTGLELIYVVARGTQLADA